jgi:hypothetical protein
MNEVHQTSQSTKQHFGRRAQLPDWAIVRTRNNECVFCGVIDSKKMNPMIFPNHINKEHYKSTSYVEVGLCWECKELSEVANQMNMDTLVHFLIYQNKQTGKNQTALAKAIEINQSQISRIKDNQVNIVHVSTALSIYREFVNVYRELMKSRRIISNFTESSFEQNYSQTGKTLTSRYYQHVANHQDKPDGQTNNQSVFSCDYLVKSSRGKPLIACFITPNVKYSIETPNGLLRYAKNLKVNYLALLNLPVSKENGKPLTNLPYLSHEIFEELYIAFDSPKDIYYQRKYISLNQESKAKLSRIERLTGVIKNDGQMAISYPKRNNYI